MKSTIYIGNTLLGPTPKTLELKLLAGSYQISVGLQSPSSQWLIHLHSGSKCQDSKWAHFMERMFVGESLEMVLNGETREVGVGKKGGEMRKAFEGVEGEVRFVVTMWFNKSSVEIVNLST